MRELSLLLLLVISSIACSGDKKMLQSEDIIGQWKEIQRRPTIKTPVYNIPDCGDEKANGQLYTFKADSTYTVRDFCPGGKPEEKGRWIYRDHVISLTKDSINMKYSLVDEGDNKIKFAIISWESNGVSPIDGFAMGYFSMFEKQ